MSKTSALSQLRQQLQRLPGVGENAAARWAQWLLVNRQGQALAEALKLALSLEPCSQCQRLAVGDDCPACADVADAVRVAVVVNEDQADRLLASGYPGYCFICHGRLSPTSGVGPAELGLAKLQQGPWQRVDAFFGDDVEDKATVLFLRQCFKGQAEVYHVTEEDGWRN
ncbi:recombination protein RecR [Bacterioplanes sanyensis]|uniref:Recombination protein RecR n=1 Tax=Bacterioplanes sanyensis TaxID=1249553 RepID=A0A222FKY5_9GAMM|nr:hypothetical protein [Bacterioplanes sanyensis]ASP39695.1 recombination protein RecR [Bacterioplanes sanyensis]